MDAFLKVLNAVAMSGLNRNCVRVAVVVICNSPLATSIQAAPLAEFSLCSDAVKVQCVEDGNTFRVGAARFRLDGTITPREIAPDCPSEQARHAVGKDLLLTFLNRNLSTISLIAHGQSDDGATLVDANISDGDLADHLVQAAFLVRVEQPARWC